VNFFSDLETLRRFNWALIFVENYFRQKFFCENNFEHFSLYIPLKYRGMNRPLWAQAAETKIFFHYFSKVFYIFEMPSCFSSYSDNQCVFLITKMYIKTL